MHVMVVYTMSMMNLMTFAKARPAQMIFITTSKHQCFENISTAPFLVKLIWVLQEGRTLNLTFDSSLNKKKPHRGLVGLISQAT
jgi:hypothetical protein